MKRLKFILLILLFLFSSVAFADDLTCQYKEKVIDKEEIKLRPVASNGDPISEIQIELPNEFDRPFKATNINRVEVSGYIDIYVLGVWSANRRGDFADYERYNFTIPAYSTIEIEHPPVNLPFGVSGANSFKFVEDPVHNYSITYYNTDLVKIKPVNSTTYKDVCKKCGANICKNDGEPCSSSSECGIGTCKIAGVCGIEDYNCPDGRLNCNNQSCVTPSVKKVGAAYSCEIECISEVGKDGVCKLNNGTKCSSNSDCISDICNPLTHICGTKGCPPNSFNHLDRDCINTYDLLFGVLVFLLTCLGVYKIVKYYTNKAVNDEIGRSLRLREKEIELLERADKLRKKEPERKREEFERELGEIRKRLETEKLTAAEIVKIKAEKEQINKDIKKINDEIDQSSKDTAEKIKRLKEKDGEWEQERLKPRKIPHFTGVVYLNRDEYPCVYREKSLNPFSEDPRDLVHLIVYKKESGGDTRTNGEQIHHIDSDKLNVEFHNLIKLTKKQHEDINHTKIPTGNYLAGVEELKKVLPELPKRVLQHLNKLESNKTSND